MNEPQSPSAAVPPTSSPQDIMMQMWMDMCRTFAVAAAARLGIADVLATSSPQESAALARAVGADATALTRLLRTLVSLGLLAQPHPQTYALTTLGAVLQSDHPDSMRDLLIAVTDPPHVQAWGKLGSEGTKVRKVSQRLLSVRRVLNLHDRDFHRLQN